MKHVGHVQLSNHESASVFSTSHDLASSPGLRGEGKGRPGDEASHDPTNGKPNAAVSQRTPRGQPGSESLKENGGRRASKRKYTTSFTPEDRACIGKYASENVNAAAVKKFKATHEIVPYVLNLSRSSHTHPRLRGVACPRAPKRIY